MEGNTPQHFHETERSHHPSTHFVIPDSRKPYIVYTDASDNACGAQLSQIYNRTEFLVAFLSHTFTDTQRRWSTPEQEA